uniref:Uncharacterized protein n=1 Tax=Hyaloperonospora arabidopsidis (strain Emoy2) TaxID=559515 RepID=M4BS58_HYAAE
METRAFSTGVSIQYPTGHSAATSASVNSDHQVEFPFAFPAASSPLSELQCRSIDTETYPACQELAYHFAYEKTRRSVQALLLKNNDTSFSQVLRFFEKYCATDKSVPEAITSSILSVGTDSTTESPFTRRRLRDPRASVLFPSLHAFPTAAVVTGTDATSNELWVEPLLQKLRHTFPLCIVVPRDVSSARRLIEWLAARLKKLCAAKHQERQWLQGLVETFDLLPVGALSVAACNIVRPLTRQERAKKSGVAAGVVQAEDQGYPSDECGSEPSCASEGSEVDLESGVSRRKITKRRRPSMVYGRWTMSKLLTTVRRDIHELVSLTSSDTSCECSAALDKMVHDRLEEALTRVKDTQGKEEDRMLRSVACFDEAVSWLQHLIITCRDTAAKLLNVALDTNNSITGHVGATEMALSLMLHRVFCQYMAYMEECTTDGAGMNDRRRSVKQEMSEHEKYYHLKGDAGAQNLASPQTPIAHQSYLLLCIEQLEVFSQRVFSDFLEIWTHFVRQQEEKDYTRATSSTLGFVIGVTSATAPALRRLDLSVTNRLELQFFSLVDSRKCFNDILESLVVKANLTLSLSGNIVRAIASRYRRLPSVPRLLLALRYLLFTHFRRCPWSFLALAVDGVPSSGESPILIAADVAPLPHRVSVWVKRHRQHLIREAQGRSTGFKSALTAWLVSCSAFELKDLESRVMHSSPDATATNNDWIIVLEAALLNERRRRARWRMGWECFRSACSWLDVRVDGIDDAKRDEHEGLAVTHLVLALEGRLGEGPRFMEVLRRLQNCRWVLLSGIIEDWHASYCVFGLYEDEGEDLEVTLRELAMLCAYARAEKAPAKMLAALRRELVSVFTNHLVHALLHPSVLSKASHADALVASWSKLTDANVLEERLRFEYHDNLRNVLQEAGIGRDVGSSTDAESQASWVHDVGLAFLFYQESASASLSLCEWYESFAQELREEAEAAAKRKGDKRTVVDDKANKARFVRAICTLRHWGFLKGDAPRDQEQDIIEKLVFI